MAKISIRCEWEDDDALDGRERMRFDLSSTIADENGDGAGWVHLQLREFIKLFERHNDIEQPLPDPDPATIMAILKKPVSVGYYAERQPDGTVKLEPVGEPVPVVLPEKRQRRKRTAGDVGGAFPAETASEAATAPEPEAVDVAGAMDDLVAEQAPEPVANVAAFTDGWAAADTVDDSHLAASESEPEAIDPWEQATPEPPAQPVAEVQPEPEPEDTSDRAPYPPVRDWDVLVSDCTVEVRQGDSWSHITYSKLDAATRIASRFETSLRNGQSIAAMAQMLKSGRAPK